MNLFISAPLNCLSWLACSEISQVQRPRRHKLE
jgi:hypothetical protein